LPTLGAMPLSHLLRGVAPIAEAPPLGGAVDTGRIHGLQRGESSAAAELDAKLLTLMRAGSEPEAILRATLALGERPDVPSDPTAPATELEPCALDGDFGVAVAVATRANLARLDATSRVALAELIGALEVAHDVADRMGGSDPARATLARSFLDALERGDAPDAVDLETAATFDDGPSVIATARLVGAAERARATLSRTWRDAERLGFFVLPSSETWPRDLVFALRSRAGPVLVAGPGASALPTRGVAAVIDLGGDDVYSDAMGPDGLPSDDALATLILELGGDDDYIGARGRLGGGVAGIGVIVDAAGRDSYEAQVPGLCAGVFGAAMLIDHGGDDRYEAGRVAFGAAVFGSAVLIDVDGDDRYQARGFAFGAAADGGFGALIDAVGYDLVIVAPTFADTNRPCIAVGGVSVAGGQRSATALWFDRRGDDILRIGQGCGAFADGPGIALAIDGAGDDIVSGSDWCLGAARAAGFALYRDLSGNDRVVARRRTLGFGSDGIGLAVDDGGADERIALDPSRGARDSGGSGVFADLPDETPR
jgi:hypothetical protein